MESASHQADHTFELNGDLFVNAFNQAKYPSTGWPVDHFIIPGDSGIGLDALASSPEETENKHRQNSGDHQQPEHTPIKGSNSRLNPRSCVTCRRRKVRCNKQEPTCTNCMKADIDCIYPPPGRAPRKPRRPQDAELLKRLRRLESVVDNLGAQVDDEGHVHELERQPNEKRHPSSAEVLDSFTHSSNRRTSLEHGLGRLMLKDGHSRYVTNDFFSMLHKEISDIKCGLDYPSSDEEADPPEPEGADSSKRYHHHQGFLFGYSSLMHDMLELRPSSSQIFIIWEIFKDNVDPVMKLLHVPTVNHMIIKAAVNPSQLSKAAEALFYSICFAAVVSMKDDQCDQLLGGTKDTLTDKYRFAVEQALARASFLNSSNLMVLQALALFLTVVKFNDTSRSIWCLAALALQQAQSQGLHRDPTNFKIPPFETEMRRRLWWHIYLQDARAAEDYGADPVSQQIFYDTRMPSNVNDNDLVCDMTEPCAERIGATDMTLCLVRFELANMQRKLRIMTSAESDDQKRNSIKEKEKLIDAEHQRMQETYFRHCDPNIPILWVASTIGKLILAKMWLFIHHPRLFQGDPSKNADDLREQVFCTSVEVIVFGSLLEKGKHTSKWSWLFHTYNQWHAVAYVLSELCHKPPGPEYDRAWAAVEAVYDKRMMEYPRSQRGVLWRPLRLMYGRAKTRRTQLVNNTSPDSNTDTNRTASADDNNVDNLAPTDGNGAENWLDSNPYMNALTESGDAFDFNIDNQSFSQGGTMGSNLFGLPAGQANLPPETPMDALPFSWNLGVADYFDDFPMQIQQTGWTPQTQQEWH